MLEKLLAIYFYLRKRKYSRIMLERLLAIYFYLRKRKYSRIMLERLLAIYFYLRKRKYSRMVREQSWKQTVLDFWKWDLGDNSRTVYERICEDYTTQEEFDNYHSSIVWNLDPKEADICLNIGCGIGRVEKSLRKKVRAIHSVDFSEQMIKMARERGKDFPNVHYYINDGQSLSMFEDNFFDIAFAELIFQHIPPDIVKAYISEVFRVLKPGGRFICQIPTKGKYQHMPRELCAWMTREEVDQSFSSFSRISYNSGCTNEWYHCPIVIK